MGTGSSSHLAARDGEKPVELDSFETVYSGVSPMLLWCELSETDSHHCQPEASAGLGEQGWPTFDKDRGYVGPAKDCKCRPKWTLARRSNEEGFRTTATSAYPPKMDEALARAIATAVAEPRSSKVGQRRTEEDQSWEGGEKTFSGKTVESSTARIGEREDDGKDMAEAAESSEEETARYTSMGEAREHAPMLAYYKGKHRAIHDGGGLCSPGRWPIKSRKQVKKGKGMALVSVCRKQFLKWILGKRGKAEGTFKELIKGKLEGSPFDDCLEEAREEIDKALEEMGMRPRRLSSDRDTEVNFRRLKAMAEVLEDEDFEYLETMAERGVPLGADETMPRTPKVFEEKVKWPRDMVEEEMREIWAENYESAEAGKEDIYRQVDRSEKRNDQAGQRGRGQEKIRGKTSGSGARCCPERAELRQGQAHSRRDLLGRCEQKNPSEGQTEVSSDR